MIKVPALRVPLRLSLPQRIIRSEDAYARHTISMVADPEFVMRSLAQSAGICAVHLIPFYIACEIGLMVKQNHFGAAPLN